MINIPNSSVLPKINNSNPYVKINYYILDAIIE
jgi:hypothetical protein